MAHGVVCHFDLPHMAQKVADWTRREGRPRADEMAHGAVCRFELPHVAENNRRMTRVDSSLWPQRTVPKLPSGTNGCQTLKTATLNTFYFCQKKALCQPPPSPTPPPRLCTGRPYLHVPECTNGKMLSFEWVSCFVSSLLGILIQLAFGCQVCAESCNES